MKKNRKRRVALLCCTVFLLSGCGNTSQPSDSAKLRDLKTMEAEMLEADKTLPEMDIVRGSDKDAEDNFTVLSDFDYERVEDYFYAYSKTGSAEEIAVIRLKDKDDVAPMMDAIHAHLEDRKGTMEEYSPEQVDCVDKAVITYEGRDVAMIVSEKNGLVQEKFKLEKEK